MIAPNVTINACEPLFPSSREPLHSLFTTWKYPIYHLGHKNIQKTVRYTQSNAKRFEGLWR